MLMKNSRIISNYDKSKDYKSNEISNTVSPIKRERQMDLFTKKGNKKHHFSRVSEIEREKLRVPTYSYLI
ncbi:hypothetical protein M2138_000025 [Dysgonomonadaceae bacterium PH5-43]|nr:hypothetical protein [Dysgonomonadaceae bacterium PH5-43]